MHDEDDAATETPPVVVGAVASGTTPLPFLAVYATTFIIHGGLHHVVPPDITHTNRGELLVGIGCLVGFFVGTLSILWLLNRHRRWPFVLVELALLALSVDFFLDATKGGRLVSGLVVVTSLLALVLAAHPQTWDHLGVPCPGPLARVFGRTPPQRTTTMPVGSGTTADAVPLAARFVGRRRSLRKAAPAADPAESSPSEPAGNRAG